MSEKIEKILKAINDLDAVLWQLRGKAVQHRDRQLLSLIGNLDARHDEIFNEIASWKRRT